MRTEGPSPTPSVRPARAGVKARHWVLATLLLTVLFAATQDRFLMRRLAGHVVGTGTVHWRTSLPDAVKEATAAHRPLFLDFSAAWCGPCQEMVRETYKDRDVAQTLNADFVPVLIDIDEHPDLADRYDAGAIPTLVILTPDGKSLQLHSVGFRSADTLLGEIDAAKKAPPQPIPSSGLPPTLPFSPDGG